VLRTKESHSASLTSTRGWLTILRKPTSSKQYATWARQRCWLCQCAREVAPLARCISCARKLVHHTAMTRLASPNNSQVLLHWRWKTHDCTSNRAKLYANATRCWLLCHTTCAIQST